MLLFCRYFVVYSVIPQVIKVNCIDCICIYRCVLMCLCICVTLADFFIFSFFFFFFYKLCRSCFGMCCAICNYLIQILIIYNVKNLITACTRSLDFDLKIEKSPYPGRAGGHPLPDPPPRSVAPLPRICHFSTWCPPPPPQCVDPRYATASKLSCRINMPIAVVLCTAPSLWKSGQAT